MKWWCAIIAQRDMKRQTSASTCPPDDDTMTRKNHLAIGCPDMCCVAIHPAGLYRLSSVPSECSRQGDSQL